MVIWQEHVLVCDDLVEAAEQFAQGFAPLIVKAASVKPLSDVVRVHGQMPGARRLCFQLWPFGGREDALDGQFALKARRVFLGELVQILVELADVGLDGIRPRLR